MAGPDPWPVAPNELIESAWGNAVVNTLGPVSTLPPIGGTNSVKDYLHVGYNQDLTQNSRLDQVEAKANELVRQNGYVAVIGVYGVGTTDASGNLRINHAPFTALPTVVVSPAEYQQFTMRTVYAWQTPSSFNLYVTWDDSGNPVVNSAIGYYYLASGHLA